ncbi:flightin-like [Macrosteles quadrilineatus]|uniref:flightin-like n=1 Tax=Macrosteles quadrilineatus TaxID=74068 RepID=UPI0023E2F058|nr:flightin-like [Macrosteles quadrilineatus]XP_054275016.1 flightin-like [Macrosteles quadrilineatus]
MAEAEAAPPVEAAPEPEPAPVEHFPPPPPKEPRRKLVFRHWIRPTFLNYHYIYDYRHNYYDDVIDYLDRRQHGLTREMPRAQTWAERALRTYTFKPNPNQYVYYTAFKKERHYSYKVAHTYRAEHTEDFFRRKYKSVLYH